MLVKVLAGDGVPRLCPLNDEPSSTDGSFVPIFLAARPARRSSKSSPDTSEQRMDRLCLKVVTTDRYRTTMNGQEDRGMWYG